MSLRDRAPDMEAAAVWEEFFVAEEGLDTAADLDEALLRELLEEEEEEDAAAAASDDDGLESAIRSFLISEISGVCGEDAAAGDDEIVVDLDSVHRRDECEECRLDDILAADNDVHGCSTASSEYEQGEDNLGWVESPCSEMEWLVEYCADELVWVPGSGCAAAAGEHSALCRSGETCLLDERQWSTEYEYHCIICNL